MSNLNFVIIILFLSTIFFGWLWLRALARLREISFRKSSLSSRYGKMAEHFMPFLRDYPYLPENFRFLGSPIDGIQFENDKIIFVEFKTADSQLSPTQKRIAELVWQKRVEFKEIRIE